MCPAMVSWIKPWWVGLWSISPHSHLKMCSQGIFPKSCRGRRKWAKFGVFSHLYVLWQRLWMTSCRFSPYPVPNASVEVDGVFSLLEPHSLCPLATLPSDVGSGLHTVRSWYDPRWRSRAAILLLKFTIATENLRSKNSHKNQRSKI